jgi:hypothetical protein
VQQTSNAVVDAQAQVVDDNMHGTTSATMKNRNQDEHDEPDGQHADDPMDETSNTARNAPTPPPSR